MNFAYGRRAALRDVSFTAPSGQVTMLLGPNGAGKTTLFSLIARLLPLQGGRISICGHDLASSPSDILSAIGIVFQQQTLDLHPDGRHLFASNEDDAIVSVIDTETGEVTASYDTGEEPEGVKITADGKLAFATSETANLVHIIDAEKNEVVKDIKVGTRPRRFALSPDGKELWVSAELSGIIDIIDVASLTVRRGELPAARHDQSPSDAGRPGDDP